MDVNVFNWSSIPCHFDFFGIDNVQQAMVAQSSQGEKILNGFGPYAESHVTKGLLIRLNK